jgi:hypothetical protein
MARSAATIVLEGCGQHVVSYLECWCCRPSGFRGPYAMLERFGVQLTEAEHVFTDNGECEPGFAYLIRASASPMSTLPPQDGFGQQAIALFAVFDKTEIRPLRRPSPRRHLQAAGQDPGDRGGC